MRIKVINPNTLEVMTQGINETVKMVARPDTEFVTVNPSRGPISIEGMYDSYLAAPQVIEEVLREKEKYDAYIIACYGDPALEAVREITEVPVIGICEASLYIASLLAPNFSIITVIPRVIVPLQQLVAKYGLAQRLASIRVTNLSVEEFAKDLVAGQRALLDEGRKAVVEDRAESLLLGCAGMAGLDAMMEKELGVPVIDGVAAAVKLAEALVDLGKKTSKINTYKYPEKKEFKGMAKIFQP
jgi:allantoin racemase